MKSQDYAVIIAGGRGTRFWPLSRAHRPKQLLKLFGKKTMIRETVERVLSLFGPARVLVVTVADHYRALQRELPMLPKGNFIVEPEGRNTAPCIGLAAVELARRHPDAAMVVLPADHWIADTKVFRTTIESAAQWARRRDVLVTIGVRPGYPETGYGYIVKGESAGGEGKMPCHWVQGFTEKPTLDAAERLLQQGALWNSGMFAWKVSTLLESLGRHAPEIAQGLRQIAQQTRAKPLGTLPSRLRLALHREYRKMPSISIDYAVLEKAGSEKKVLTLEGDFGWSDVGNWAALHRMLPQDASGNGGVGKWLAFQSRGCLVYSSGRLVSLLGMEDVLVVDTPDALLVGSLQKSQEVRELVAELEREGYKKLTVK